MKVNSNDFFLAISIPYLIKKLWLLYTIVAPEAGAPTRQLVDAQQAGA
jgi:hypothetical protein